MSALPRTVEPEWLDMLPPDDPRAQRSRADLRRVNAIMGNAGIVADLLGRSRAGGVRRIAEIGAGDGSFALRVARGLPRPAASAEVVLVDRVPIVKPGTLDAFRERGWRARAEAADVFDWLAQPESAGCDAIFANLFLHHFESGVLARLLAAIAARTPCFVACEPRRSAFALGGSRLLALLGCNDVTRHDATVSVRAGFAAGELTALWPASSPWAVDECARGMFSHAFSAVRP